MEEAPQNHRASVSRQDPGQVRAYIQRKLRNPAGPSSKARGRPRVRRLPVHEPRHAGRHMR